MIADVIHRAAMHKCIVRTLVSLTKAPIISADIEMALYECMTVNIVIKCMPTIKNRHKNSDISSLGRL